MKRIFTIAALSIWAVESLAAQTPVTTITAPGSGNVSLRTYNNTYVNPKLSTIESNRQDHESRVAAVEAGKADKTTVIRYWSDWPDASPGNTLAAGTIVAYDGKLYKVIQAFTKTAGATPAAFTSYFSEVTGSGSEYTLPTASADTKGGIIVGDRLTITDGVLSADVQSGGTTYTEGTGIDITDGVISATVTDTFASWDKDYADLINKPTIPTVSDAAYGSGWNGDTGAASKNAIYDKIESLVLDSGSMTWPTAAGIMVYGGSSAYGDSLTLVTTVGATGADTSVPTEQGVREAINALPNLVFDTATLTVTEDTPSAGTDTVSVKTNTFQAYDADWLGITANGASLVSAADYAAMKTLLDTDDIQTLTGITAGTAHLGTFTGTTIADSSTIKSGMQALETAVEGKQATLTLGTGVSTALGNNTGAVGGLSTVIASGTYTVDTAEIAANTCASAVAVTASGVATTDAIIATPNAILSTVTGFGVTSAGAVRVDVYPTSGNVNFQFCNPTGTAIDPGSVSFNWKVLR